MLDGLKSRVPVPGGPEQMERPEPHLKEKCLWQNAWLLPQLLIPHACKATRHRTELILSKEASELQKSESSSNVFSMPLFSRVDYTEQNSTLLWFMSRCPSPKPHIIIGEMFSEEAESTASDTGIKDMCLLNQSTVWFGTTLMPVD